MVVPGQDRNEQTARAPLDFLCWEDEGVLSRCLETWEARGRRRRRGLLQPTLVRSLPPTADKQKRVWPGPLGRNFYEDKRGHPKLT